MCQMWKQRVRDCQRVVRKTSCLVCTLKKLLKVHVFFFSYWFYNYETISLSHSARLEEGRCGDLAETAESHIVQALLPQLLET